MIHNGYKLNNNIQYHSIDNMFNNENYPYNNELRRKNQFGPLLNMKNDSFDNTSKNINMKFFKNYYKSNKKFQSSEGSGGKENRYKALKKNNNQILDSSSNKMNNNFFNNFFNEDVQFMNMKIDLRLIEHKLNCLLNIYTPEEIYIPKNNKNKFEKNDEKINFNNENRNKNENQDYENKYYINNSNKNNNLENDEEDIKNNINDGYDNNQVNGQNKKMSIEKVVSYNNKENLNENITKNEPKMSRMKKNKIIQLLSDRSDEQNNIEKNKKAINKDDLENIKKDNENDNKNNIINININKSTSEERAEREGAIYNSKNDSKDEKNNNLKNNNLIDNTNNDNIENKNEENENIQLIPEKDYNSEKDYQKEIENNQKMDKKVHFDENLVYINYDQDDYITEIEITDQNGKYLPYKAKDFTKYLRLLTSVSNPKKLQPCISKSHQKKKKKKKNKTKIMERNIEFIKKLEKTGNIYSNLREYEKKAPNSESKNCKKFMENPQHFFTEDLCDVMLLQYDINPKEVLNSSTNINKKSKEKK